MVTKNLDRQMTRAYTAGFLDGEGCVQIKRTIRHSVATYRCFIEAGNTNREILAWLAQHYGGYLRQLKRKKIFCTNAKPMWVWSISEGTGLRKFACWMFRYSIVKHEHLRLMLAVLDKEIDSEVAFQEMRALNHRGIKLEDKT